MRTKKDSEVIKDIYGKKLVLKCYDKANEDRIKCEEEFENDSIRARVIILIFKQEKPLRKKNR